MSTHHYIADHTFVQGIASARCQHRLDAWNSCLRPQADHGYEIPMSARVENIYPHPLSAEASEIGLRPGEWPNTLIYEGVPFRRISHDRTPDGERTGMTYSSGSLQFRLHND